jgi:small multidrug resistance pump
LYAGVVLGYVASFVLLTRTIRAGLGIGLTYAIWAGCGVALVALGSKVFYQEPLNGVMLVGMSLIVGGVALVELGAAR